MSAFKYNESLLAKIIGLSRSDMRQWREHFLSHGSDWAKNGREIMLSHSAVRKIAKMHSIPIEQLDFNALAEKNGADDPTKIFTVTKIPINPRMILAADEDGAEQMVEVGRNATFAIGDQLEVERHPAYTDIWLNLSPIPRDKRRSYHANEP